jgi:hypothetical protein
MRSGNDSSTHRFAAFVPQADQLSKYTVMLYDAIGEKQGA